MRQKGFTSESGCKINIELLNSALNYSKRNNGGIFTIVDISKAFDTVPHAALKPCLAKNGVPAPIVDLIGDMYKECKTNVRTKDGGVEITIRRGVKQGDPLSPLLFNLCLEPLLEAIEEQCSGLKINENRKVPVLAFADDVVLREAEAREVQHQVNVLIDYLQSLEMNLSIKAGGSLYKPDLVIKNGERVLVVDVTVRYENKDYLAKAEKEKIEKYRPCLKALKELFNASGGEILPVVLGSRGTITPGII